MIINQIKQAIILLVTGGFILLMSSCNMNGIVNQVAQGIEHREDVLLRTETFPIPSIEELQVTTSGGSITVNGGASQEAVLEMYVRSNHGATLSQAEIQDLLERDYDIEVKLVQGVLHASAKRKSSFMGNNPLSISFKIHTGSRVKTNLNTSGGSIELANLIGEQRFRTSGGSLTIDQIKGDVFGETSGGSIHAANGQGLMDLRTSGGSIRLENLEGDVTAITSGGGIKAGKIKGELAVETSGGSIRLDDMACTLNASTSGGSVRVGIQELVGAVQLSTAAGSVHLTLPQGTSADLKIRGSKVHVDGLSNFQGTNEKGKLVGRMNGGGTLIQASTSGGNVNVSFN